MNPRRYFHERRVLRPFLRWIVSAVVILLTAAGTGDSAGPGPTTSTGSQVTKSVPFARESIDEIRALAPFRSLSVPGNRAIPFRRIPGRSGSTGEAGLPAAEPALAAPPLASPPAPSAPAPDSSFAGLGNPPHTEGDVIPPDTMGAVGPNHLVSILNSDFGVFDKATGLQLQKSSLQSFWASLDNATVQPSDFPFDPKILYDQHSERFVAITLGGRSALDSWVMIAVSATSDPTGAWSKWAIDADKDNDVQLFNNSADFPGLGVDAFNVYVTANMFSPAGAGQYSKAWVIPKAQLLAGANPITWFEFRNPTGSDFSMQPAHTFGTPGVEYILFEGLPNHLGVAWIDNVSGTPVWHFPLQVQVDPVYFDGLPAGRPAIRHRLHDRHGGYAPAELRVPERFRVDHPPCRRERKGGGRLVQDQPGGNRHGGVAGTHQRPESLVLLPLRRGQQGRRRRDRVQRLVDRRIRRGVLHPHPAIHRHRGVRGAAEGG